MAQTMTVTQENLLSGLLRELQAVVRPGESAEALLKTTVEHLVAERKAARMQAACARAQEVLGGTFKPFDPQAAYQRRREKYGWTEDLSTLTDEELMDRADATLAAMPPEKIAELERLGFL